MTVATASKISELDPASTECVYAWVKRSEVVFLQAVTDAYEGLARIRTERHDPTGEKSLLLFLVNSSRKTELLDFLRHLEQELEGKIEIV